MPGQPNYNLKEICATGSEIINATDGRRKNFDFMSAAHTVDAELK